MFRAIVIVFNIIMAMFSISLLYQAKKGDKGSQIVLSFLTALFIVNGLLIWR